MLGSRLLEIVIPNSSRESSVCSDEESCSPSAETQGGSQQQKQQQLEQQLEQPTPQPLRHALSFRGRLQTSGVASAATTADDSGWQRLGVGGSGSGLQRARSMREGRRPAAATTEDVGAASAAASSTSTSPRDFQQKKQQLQQQQQQLQHRQLLTPCSSRSPRAFEAEVSVEHFKFDLYQTAEPAAATTQQPPLDSQEERLQQRRRVGEDGRPCGLVNLRICYDFDSASLTVGLRHAKDLRLATGESGADLSPFARVQLQPRKQQQKISAVQKRTGCPIWNEQLRFDVPDYRACQAAELEIELRSHGRRGSRRIGFARVQLDAVNVQAGETLTLPVHPCLQEPEDIGDVLLSLHYLPNAKRLSVDIVRVRNLLQEDVTKKLEPLVKVSFHDGKKVVKTKKTGKRSSLTGELRDTFRLDIAEADLDQLTIGLRVFSQPLFKESLIGQASVGRMSSGAEEAELWRQLLAAGHGGTGGASDSVTAWVPLRQKLPDASSSASVGSGSCAQASP